MHTILLENFGKIACDFQKEVAECFLTDAYMFSIYFIFFN